MSDMRGSSVDGLTGFTLGEGGMPRVRRGALGAPLLRAPGTGGLNIGAGDDILLPLQLFSWWSWVWVWLWLWLRGFKGAG